MWRAFTPEGYLQYPEFIDTVNAIVPMWVTRVVGGLLYVAGIALMAYNYFMTWRTRPAKYDVPVVKAPPLSSHYDDGPAPESRLKGAPVTGWAHSIDKFEQAHWHRVWERLPVKFTVWVTIAVVGASLFELVPSFLIRSNVPTIPSVKPYTPLELLGRDIYVAEGCYNCHSQQIRPMFAETERYGQYSKAGEFIYDRPFQWGSRRIGPDMAREGGRQSHFWHWEHFKDPDSMTKGSRMPAYQNLLDNELNLSTVQKRINVAAFLGAEYDRELTEAEEMAREQAHQIMDELREQGGPSLDKDKIPMAIAVIAYLQRLGTDINATETEASEEPESEGSATADGESGKADAGGGQQNNNNNDESAAGNAPGGAANVNNDNAEKEIGNGDSSSEQNSDKSKKQGDDSDD